MYETSLLWCDIAYKCKPNWAICPRIWDVMLQICSSYVMSHQSIAWHLEQIAQFVLIIQYVISKHANFFNKFLSDISALLLHTCVQLRQPYKLVETTQSFFTAYDFGRACVMLISLILFLWISPLHKYLVCFAWNHWTEDVHDLQLWNPPVLQLIQFSDIGMLGGCKCPVQLLQCYQCM